jgi:hypothetical protein
MDAGVTTTTASTGLSPVLIVVYLIFVVTTVFTWLVNEGVGAQGFPVTAVRIASNAVRPCLRAVET